jgi:hypothetical protein
MTFLLITHSLKMSDDTMVEGIKSTEQPANSPDVNRLDCHICKEFKPLMDRSKRKTFQNLELLWQGIFNILPLVTQHNILPDTHQGKRQVHATTQAKEGAVPYGFR